MINEGRELTLPAHVTRSRPLLLASLTLIAGFLALSPAAGTECRVFDAATNEQHEADCSVDYPSEGEVIQVGKTRFIFVQSGRQGQWSTGTLNGKPAARYEINRSTFSYATLDLTLFIDRSDD